MGQENPTTETAKIELSNATSVAMEFVKAINAWDLEWILSLMSEQHRFIDSIGHTMQGKEAMREAWGTYFKMFPDYRISVAQMVSYKETVVLLGSAKGTFALAGNPANNGWVLPAAFKAVIMDGQVLEWQVYADNEPVRKIVESSRQPARPS